MGRMDLALREGYETSRRMQRRHDPTYYFATRRLPPEIRPATHALYGYVRVADQMVDGPRRSADPAARRAAGMIMGTALKELKKAIETKATEDRS